MTARYNREGYVLKLFSVLVTSVSFLAGQVLIASARYGSIVIALSTVACLVKVDFSS